MAVVKISDLPVANGISVTDLLYLANNGNARKLSLDDLLLFIKSHIAMALSVNGNLAVNNAITLSKSDLGLGNVPNAAPVGTLNGKTDAVVITAGNAIAVTVAGQTIEIAVSPALTLDWAKLTGSWESQLQLATAMASVGVQQGPRTTVLNDIVASDLLRQWVDVDIATPVQMVLPASLNAPVGALLELRQKGLGTVTATGDATSLVTQPVGAKYVTTGVGSRIQLVSLGNNAWEFK